MTEEKKLNRTQFVGKLFDVCPSPEGKKVNFAEKIEFIYENGYDGLVKRFIFVNITHICFETLISVYILEMVGIFTKLFLIDPDKISLLRDIVILPFVLMITLAVVFGICASYYFANHVYIYAQDYGKMDATEENYKIVTSRYKKQIITVQVFGFVCYVASTIIIPLIFINHYSDNIEQPLPLMITIPILGSILGFAWNITGIFRNQRLLWTRLLPNFAANKKIRNTEWTTNYKYYVLNAIGILFSVVVIFTLFVFVLLNLHDSLLEEKTLGNLASNYVFLFAYFVALVGFYIKYVVKHLYCTWNDSGIFPSLKRIMK